MKKKKMMMMMMMMIKHLYIAVGSEDAKAQC